MVSLKDQLRQGLITNSIQTEQNRLKKLTKSVTDEGIDALDFVGEEAGTKDFVAAKELIQMNFGAEYPEEKFTMLFDMIKEDRWSKDRFAAVLKWFLKNKKYPTWTIADWYEQSESKLFPYSKYLKELQSNAKLNEQIDKYKINNVFLWKYKDGVDLPFEKIK